jgi:hypothetical protein
MVATPLEFNETTGLDGMPTLENVRTRLSALLALLELKSA